MFTLKLALKNLTRQKKRNILLAIAISFGFLVVTSLESFVTGFISNLETQITQLVGGTVLLQGFEKTPPENGQTKSKLTNIIRDKDYIANIIKNGDIKYKSISQYSVTSATLIFEGQKSSSTVYGRYFDDQDFTESFTFIEGNLDTLLDEKFIIINDKTASTLNVKVGDRIILKTETIYNQNAVDDFVVQAIFKSNSILNTIMAYTDINVLNKIIEIPENGYSTLTVFLEDKNDQEKLAQYIEDTIRKDNAKVTSRQDALKTNPNNIGRGLEKQLFNEYIQWDGTKYAIETINDEFPQLDKIFFYVHLISTIILVVILLIIMVGVSNTYKMVLYDRIREIGTMRAIGSTKKHIRFTILFEAILLCIIGAIAGTLLSLLLMTYLSSLTFTSDLMAFLCYKSHLVFQPSIVSILIQYLVLILFTVLAVLSTSSKAAAMSPAVALRTIK